MDKKWRELLNVAAAGPAAMDYSGDFRRMTDGLEKAEFERPPREAPVSGVNTVTVEAGEGEVKIAPRMMERAPQKCKFSETTGCTGSHPLWLCKAFGDKTPEERSKIFRITSCSHSACFAASKRCAI